MTPEPDRPAPQPTRPGRPRVAVLADDLIWASRLVAAAERGGAKPVRLPPAQPFGADGGLAAGFAGAIVDLGGRAYDGVATVAALASAGLSVIAVGQHDDVALRRRALAAGAARVYSYNKLFRDGPAVIAAWLDQGRPGA